MLIGELDCSRMREVTMRAKALGLMIVGLSVQDETLGTVGGPGRWLIVARATAQEDVAGL